MREFIFCKRMELNEQISAKQNDNGFYFYKGHNEVKVGQPNEI